MNSLALKEESNGCHVLALSFAERVHELLKLGTTLDLEKDLVVVVRHLDVEVLSASGVGIRALASRATVVILIRHLE